MSEALYRKYRPQVFSDVVGQDHIETTLKNAIDQDKVSHAYLFCGPRGTGKTTTARLLAKALLCTHGPTSSPDGTCDECLLIASGQHPDVYELDAASRTGVENVREEIIGRVHFAPTRSRAKIYIIDEVHMLSTAAFNALLKTLEEPPQHVVFILCTTDPQKVPETIHSRCQRFDFHRIAAETIVSRLGAICVEEGVDFQGEALELIAQRAEGGMRDALTSLDQLIAFGEGSLTLDAAKRLLGSLDSNDLHEIISAIGNCDVGACFTWTANYVETGADLAQFTRDLSSRIRNLYILSLSGADVELDISEAQRRELVSELALFGPERFARLLCVLGDLSAELRTSTNTRLIFEIALTRMVRPESDLTLESLAARIESLEAIIASGANTQKSPFHDLSCVAQAPHNASPSSSPGGCGSQMTPENATDQKSLRDPDTPDNNLENPVILQRLWRNAQSVLKRHDAPRAVLFMNTRAQYLPQTASIVVRFSPESGFAFKAAQKPGVSEVVQEAITEAFGIPIPFSLAQDQDGKTTDTPPDVSDAEPPLADAAQSNPDVTAADTSPDASVPDGATHLAAGAEAFAAKPDAPLPDGTTHMKNDIENLFQVFGDGVKIKEITD